MRVLRGVGCGCKKNYTLRGIDFYKGKETVLYYIKIIKDNLILYKPGVTLFKESIESRWKRGLVKN